MIIMLLTLYISQDGFMLTTAAFTILIVLEMLNIYTEIHIRLIKKKMILAQIGSVLMYIISVVYFKETFNAYYFWDAGFWLIVLKVILVGWLPFVVIRII